MRLSIASNPVSSTNSSLYLAPTRHLHLLPSFLRDPATPHMLLCLHHCHNSRLLFHVLIYSLPQCHTRHYSQISSCRCTNEGRSLSQVLEKMGVAGVRVLAHTQATLSQEGLQSVPSLASSQTLMAAAG